MAAKSLALSPARARAIWLHAQRLDTAAPFGTGPEATPLAIEHLGYVQIDTINVIERCHHHILYSRVPDYRRAHLAQAQSVDKAVFEYWTHALAYVPVETFRFFMPGMKAYRNKPSSWFATVTPAETRKMLKRIRTDGPLTMRDIDDEPVEKTHPWASKKPSKRVLEMMFYQGLVAISQRTGMVKTYELTERHFGWDKAPKPATAKQITEYLLDRALRAQGVVSLDSVCHLDAPSKAGVLALIESRVRRKLLVPVHLEHAPKAQHWVAPELLEAKDHAPPELVHILSPFDPLIIQRKRLSAFFGYDHIFEAYVPAPKRKLGYFALPVLVGDRIVAALDLKTDRAAGKLLVQKWTWIEDESAGVKAAIEDALGRFERFQLGG